MARVAYRYRMRFGIDPKYARLANPLPPIPADIEAGLPPFKATLSADEIWKLVLYVRSLRAARAARTCQTKGGGE